MKMISRFELSVGGFLSTVNSCSVPYGAIRIRNAREGEPQSDI